MLFMLVKKWNENESDAVNNSKRQIFNNENCWGGGTCPFKNWTRLQNQFRGSCIRNLKEKKTKWLNLTLRNSKSGSLEILQSDRLFHLNRWLQVVSSTPICINTEFNKSTRRSRSAHNTDLDRPLGPTAVIRQLQVSVCSRLEGPVTYSALRSFLDRRVTSFVIGRFTTPRWSVTWWRQ